MNLKLFWLTHPRQKNVLPSYISHFEKNVSKKVVTLTNPFFFLSTMKKKTEHTQAGV